MRMLTLSSPHYASSAWGFSSEPFPAYRAAIEYGPRKRDRTFLPVLGGLTPGEEGVLADGSFCVVTSRKSGRPLIVPPRDAEKGAKDKSALVLATVQSGYRGDVELLEGEDCILACAKAVSAWESGMAVALLMQPGQAVVVARTGREVEEPVEVWTWDGETLSQATYDWEEYDFLREEEEEKKTDEPDQQTHWYQCSR